MPHDKTEDEVRRRAYEIWEEQGRPDGLHQEHWEQARREFEGREGQAVLQRTLTETIGLVAGIGPTDSGPSERSTPAGPDPQGEPGKDRTTRRSR